MKKIILGFILIITMSFCLLEDNNYYLLFEKANNIKLYKYGKHYYYEYFMDEKKEINGNLYYVEIRKYSFGDIHIYKDHIEGLSEQLLRVPYDNYPELIINPNVKDFNDFELKHFEIKGYKHQGKIVLPVSV